MRYLFSVVLAMGLVSCDGRSTPTSPTLPQQTPPVTLAKANIVSAGGSQWVNCLFGCAFQADGRNTGPGCARSVRGVTRFFDKGNMQVGASYSWSLAADAVLRVNELFTYRTVFSASTVVPTAVVEATTSFTTEFFWTDTAC